uniref:Nudix hydrolase domain-containing protein n=1 Tax=Denticeps clupeoides TaxID=299321 RepID=A0AAY4BGW5_9TELE
MDAKEKAKEALRRFEVGNSLSCLPALPKASVLIPLFVRGGELHVLLTVRSPQLRSNAGEVCFPGGKYEPEDRDEIETALREAEEEIGLPPDQVEVVCRLWPMVTKRGLLVTPRRVHCAPGVFFTQAHKHTCYALATLPGFVHFFMYLDPASGKRREIWGLTALLAIVVAAVALEKKPAFTTGFDVENPLAYFQRSLDLWISKL